MPVHAAYDLVSSPPPVVDSPFALAARRILETWLDTRELVATVEHVKLAGEFLQGRGLRLEPLSSGEVRLSSSHGRATVMSREAAVMTAIRCLVGVDSQRTSRSVARAA